MAAAPAAASPSKGGYDQHNLVSNQPGVADNTDAHLVNAWGLSAGPTSPWWVSDNGADVSTLYNAVGTPLPLVVSVPGAPTGTVFNGTAGAFPVAGKASTFLFDTEGGTILGWNGGTAATVEVDRSPQGAVYKGLAIASTPSGPRIYATDFHNGAVDVFDSAWQQVRHPGFVDRFLPRHFAPFGIQAIGDRIYVTYAKQEAGSDDEAHGQGLGIVDAFDTSGHLVARVAQHGRLNAPWGLAWAPSNFGRFSGDLLVGNFGDGRITAYHQFHRLFLPAGQLRMADGRPLAIDGLWALEFGMGAANNGPTDSLFFTAGPDDESNGLFGTIRAHG
ncbi:TIGR03118 family protein [Solirubrobacter soli]|uniref:TIGR03118 family protein n=1 Tax=Solirubrobacter soli TaxID=363832 RepID=UPI00040517EA|nr:TIGR03118 family protein [Solirubrobacter soli]